VQQHLPIITVLAAFMVNNASDVITTTSQKSLSMEHQRFLVLQLGQPKGYGSTLTHNHPICRHYVQKDYQRYGVHILK
jgi:hypothetical protein